ncbi:MAG: hypothetical protein K0R71_1134 [Bacillales bacterium]|jgi:c-di-GMP-binding flagellar brake protein YcgR|nr:hypothetical protein [Bacillales bacterium]
MFPKINQNIIINVNNEDKSWKSIVSDVNEGEILIGLPMDLSNFGMLQVGTAIEVTYTSDVSRYKFLTEIIGKKIENIPLLILKKPEEKEIMKVQLREDFRVNVNIPLLLNDKEVSTINLSAGGLLCSSISDFGLIEGETVSGSIFLPGFSSEKKATISFQCKITRINFLKDLERYQIAIKFIEIDNLDQKKIIQYCIEKQRQLRLKERMV